MDVRDHRLGLATVTDVEVTKDLSAARVYISALGDRAAADQAVEVLNESAPYLSPPGRPGNVAATHAVAAFYARLQPGG